MFKAIKKVSGIVFKKKELFNGDRELHILTQSGFRIRLLVKGIAGSSSREVAASDLFSFSEFLFYSKNMVVSKLGLIRSYENIRKDLNNLKGSFYLAKVIDMVTYENDRNEELFTALLSSLEKVNLSKVHSAILLLLSNVIKSQGVGEEEIKTIEEAEQVIYSHLDTRLSFKEFMNYV